MVGKPLKILFIISCFFSFILSKYEVDNERITSLEGCSGTGSKSFLMDLRSASYKFDNCIDVKVIPTFGSVQMAIITSEQGDDQCLKQRQALSIQTYETIHLFLTKEEISESKYICVKCLNDDEQCQYDIKLASEKECELNIDEQASYSVNTKNTEMTFKFNNNKKTNFRNLETVYDYLNVWVKGKSIQSTNLKAGSNNIDPINFGFGDVYLIDMSKNNEDSYVLNVKSEEGDYITVGSLGISSNEAKSLKVNDLEIMGFLNNNLETICFTYDEINYKNQDSYLAQINGNIYTKKAFIYDEYDGKIIKESSIENGIFLRHVIVDQDIGNQKFCIGNRGTKSKGVIFSFQFTSNENNNKNQYIFPPQLPGVIYNHFLPKGAIAIFRGMTPTKDATEINFNMRSIKGFPDMRFDAALDFPEAEYNAERIINIRNPHHANRMTVFSFYLNDEKTMVDFKDYNSISASQPLIVVECLEGQNDEEQKSLFCEFETSIFSNKDRINLIEKETYSQYLLDGETDLYTINIEHEENLHKIYLDLIVFSGDVNFEVENEESFTSAHKYYLSNKIFYSITVGDTAKKIDFKVTAQKNSFYIVAYQIVIEGDESKNVNEIESGVNFVQSIYIGDDADYMKYVKTSNLKYEQGSDFLINFYSQNCQFVISRTIGTNDDGTPKEEYFPMHDSYSQIIINSTDEYYYSKDYTFRIDITGDDPSQYNKKLCMIYVSGLELSNSTEGSERTISVSEGVPQYYLFTKEYPYMKYTYFVSDINNDLVINFNLLDKGTFDIKVSHNYNYIITKEIFRNEIIVINKEQLKEKCVYDDEVCPIDVYIDLKSTSRDRRVETTIYQVNGAPIYLEKNAIKQDIIFGSVRKRYYLDLGKDETGDITMDYIRGSGYIYATIVDKNKVQDKNEADWRGMYKFPTTKDESLSYGTYLKKIVITKEDTKDCEDGCYLLITVESSVYEENSETEGNYIPYRITITPRILPEGYELSDYLIPRIKMKVNQFVLGNLFNSTDQILTFYQVTLPYESDHIIIDWQADKPSFCINIGTKRPDKENCDFKFETIGHDTVYRLSKEDIIKKANMVHKMDLENSIRNVDLTLGLWTNVLDTLYTSMYAFKIFMPPIYTGENPFDREVIEIIHIRSDQKVQCHPLSKGADDKYSCLFAVIFDEGDAGKNLIVYPRAQMENLQVRFIGSIIDSERIEKNDMQFIVDTMKNPDDQYSSASGRKYLYYQGIEKDKSLLFLVEVTQDSIIEVLSSIYSYNEEQTFVPNPSTPQVFAIKDKKIFFNFETTRDLLINIVCISGHGYFYWEIDGKPEQTYFLGGFEDRLTLTSGVSNSELKFSKLVAQSTTFSMFEIDESGFVFYVTFYPRNSNYNIDQLKVGRATEINYREAIFPLSFFAKLTDKDISISFTFYNYYLDKDFKLEYEKPLLNIWGKVISEEEALEARINPHKRPTSDNSISGAFDGAFGTLFLSAEDIAKYNLENNPYLFFNLEMQEQKVMNNNGIGLEVSILREQSESEQDFCVPEYVYLNGKLSHSKKLINGTYIYKLRTNYDNKYMNIEFSSNNDLIKWNVAYDKDLNNTIDAEKKFLNGRYIMTFEVDENILINQKYVYLVVYYDKENEIDNQLSNYVFKYMNGKGEDSFYFFPQKMDNLSYTVVPDEANNKKTFKISFKPVEQYNVNYYIKAVYKETLIPAEIEETLAISESPGYVIEIDNPEIDGDNITLSFSVPKEKQIAYIKVMSKVEFQHIKEYLLYKPIQVFEDQEFPEVKPEELVEPYEKVIKRSYNEDIRQIRMNANNAPQKQNYQIEFPKGQEIPNYIKVKITNLKEKDNKNKIIYISPDNQDAKENRIQLVQTGVENSVDIWIKNEELKDSNLYATIECQIDEDEKCDYLIEFIGYKYVVIESSAFNYNYYVNEKNTEMVFSIKNDLTTQENKGQTITLYANGGKEINIKLENCIGIACNQYKFRTGAAITSKIQNHNYFQLTVSAQEGDYISVGSKITEEDGKSEKNVLKANSYQFTGYLKKKVLEKECYLLPEINDKNNIYYLVGMFYNTATKISFRGDNIDNIINEETTTKGHFSYVHTYEESNKKKYICIELPDPYEFNIEDLAYSLQLTQPVVNKEGLFNLYAPQLSGTIYPRIIPKGSYVFFNGANLKSDSNDIIYNMISSEGLPVMYIYKCTDYPICNFDFSKTDEVTKINEINSISSWHNKETEKNNSPIDKTQYIMIVKCEDLTELGSEREYCKFQTSIYGNNDEIYLSEGQSFSQYILKGQKTKYIIDFSYENDATKIHVDTLVISGDVKFDLTNDDKEIVANKYYLANKIFYSVHLYEPENSGLKKIIVDITANENSYYIIEYKVTRGEKGEFNNTIYEGINYLIPFSTRVGENKKIVKIHNSRILKDSSYLVNFYSLNCLFRVKRENNEEVGIDTYSQDIISNNNEEFITYYINAIDTELSDYKNKMCMLYISGIEITKNKESSYQKPILMGEGVPHKVIFENISRIDYIYPISNREKNIEIYLKVINTAEYKYSISLNSKQIVMGEEFSKSLVVFHGEQISDSCGENEICNIIVSIIVQKKLAYTPILELTIKQIGGNPYYIPKGVVRQDYVAGDSWLNVFTILGKDDEGYITLDFARGSGEVYAKIVKFDEEDKDDQDENAPKWRGFSFPRKQYGTLKYEFYNKKIIFSNTETKDCENGCYLLISLKSSAIGKLNEQYRFHPLTITVGLTPSSSGGVEPLITLDPEQYVVGSLTNREKIKNKKMYEYYEVTIPFDADRIQIDWQSDSAVLLINFEPIRPTIDKYYNYKREFRNDTIFEISKNEIKEILNNDKYRDKKVENINGFSFIIGVYTEDYESIYGTAYSLRVHFIKDINIYKVSSDQKTLCKPEKIDNSNNYRCLFMVIYADLDFIYDLMIYSRSQSPSALTYMYGNFIDSKIYDTFNVDELKKNIPLEGATNYDTKKNNIDFIFLTLSQMGVHFFVNVESDKPDIIEFITSFKTFDTELSPNPSSIQLYSINNDKYMTLKFITTKPLFINIVSLYGDSKIYFKNNENTKYSLRGRDDRLSLAIPSGEESYLIIENNKFESNNNNILLLTEENQMEKPKLAFYLEYYLRSIELNLDEIYFGKTDEIIYKKSDFPFYYYAKLNNIKNSVNAFFILHDLEYNQNMEEINSTQIDIRGTVISQKTIYLIKVNEESKPNLDNSPIIGIYDPAIQVGQVFFNPKDLDTGIDNPTIYLSLEKNNKEFSIKSARIELAVVQENTDVVVTEKLYQYGKINDKNTVNHYRLKVDNSTGYMRIQFSTNSENIDYKINKSPGTKTDQFELEEEEKRTERGKTFITFKKPKDAEYIYLHVFLKEKPSNEKIQSNNYVFKYMNSDSKEKFFEYQIKNSPNIVLNTTNKEYYIVKFNKINKDNVEVIYSIKGVESNNYKNENFTTIALTESPSTVIKKNNSKEDEISVKIDKKNGRSFNYFQVIAQIRDGPITEYEAYNTYIIKETNEPGNPDNDNDDDDNSNTKVVVIIIISAVLFVIIIILVVIIFTFNAKNKGLMDQVNKISFVQSGAKSPDDGNLLLENQNELE